MKMAALQVGTVVYLCYNGDPLHHERILLAWVQGSDYIAVIPDGEVYIEQIDATSPDLDAMRLEAPGGG